MKRALREALEASEKGRQYLANEKAARASRSRRTAGKKAPGREAKKAKRVSKTAANAKAYAAVRERDNGLCTVTLPADVIGACGGRLTIDHQWGRGKAETTVENCRMLCWDHHQRKTDGVPDRATWLRDFLRHGLTHEYHQEVAKADAMIALECAQHPVRIEVKEGA